MEKVKCLQGLLRHHIGINLSPNSQIYHFSKQALHSTTRCSAFPLPHLAAPGPPPSPPKQEITGSKSSLDHRKRKIDQLAKRKALEQHSRKSSAVLQKRFWKEVNIKEDEGM